MLESKYHITKRRAQRLLKRGLQNKLLFTPKHTNPQLYYPESRHFEVVEYLNDLEKSPKDTTGTDTSKYPLWHSLENQKANGLLEAISVLPWIPLHIHKIILQIQMDKEFYDLISTSQWKGNCGKHVEDFIENRLVTYQFYRNGNLIINVACSNRPFKLESEDDLVILYGFFGQVRNRLEDYIRDPKGRLTPNITSWVLQQCDFNKDVPITDKAQVTLPDIQLSTAFRTFRMYVKNLKGKAYFRCEESVQVNELLTPYLSSKLSPNAEILSKLQEVENMIKNKLSR